MAMGGLIGNAMVMESPSPENGDSYCLVYNFGSPMLARSWG